MPENSTDKTKLRQYLFAGLVAVVIVIGCLVSLIIVIRKKSTPEAPQTIVQDDQAEFSFYYPSRFEKYTNNLQLVSYRQKGDKQPINIGVARRTDATNFADLDQAKCEANANSVLFLLSGTLVRADYIQRNQIRGCEYKIEGSYEGKRVVTVVKELAKTGDTFIYAVNATYLADTDAEVAKLLEESVSKFEIKN